MEMAILMQDAAGTPKVSVDEAATIASEFLGQSGDTSLSKSLAAPKCDVYLRRHTSLKKAASDESDTLFYLFNYGEDNGYAVVSADVRVPQQVLAYSDEGSISLDTDNPGLNIFYDLAEQYVDESIAELEESRDSLEAELDSKLFGSDTTQISLSKANAAKTNTNTYVRSFQRIYKSIPLWESTSIVGPYLTTSWAQGAPYNRMMPYCQHSKVKYQFPAGCSTIATGQLMAYWRYPKSLNGKTIRWNEISEYPNAASNSGVDTLIKYVAGKIGVEYRCNNSTETIDNHSAVCNTRENVLPFLDQLGYHTTAFAKYDTSSVIKSLNSRRPVLVSGGGHSWLFDGYVNETYTKRQINIVNTILYVDGKQVSNDIDTIATIVHRSWNYIHCNWGWGSKDNGYCYGHVFNNSEYHLKDSTLEQYIIKDIEFQINDSDLKISTNIYH